MKPFAPLIAAATILAACVSPGTEAHGQDLGMILTRPVKPPVPQTAQTLRRDIGPESPARLMMIGDSLADGFGQLLVQRAAARGLPMRVSNRGKVSTGLARSDYYDWPGNFAQMAEIAHPDIVVAHFGANDMQAILAPEGRTGFGTETWDEAYRTQIRKILRSAAAQGAVVYWLGPAPDSHGNLNRHLARINPLFAEEAAAAGATYVSLTALTAPSGTWERTPVIAGTAVSMRSGDGSHFTGRGYGFVADAVLDALIARFPELEPTQVATRLASVDPLGFALQ